MQAQTRVVATRLEDRALFIDAAIVPPPDTTPMPKIGQNSIDPTSEKHSTDLAQPGLLEQPGPYDPPPQSKDFDKDAPHWPTFDLKGPNEDLAPLRPPGFENIADLPQRPVAIEPDVHAVKEFIPRHVPA